MPRWESVRSPSAASCDGHFAPSHRAVSPRPTAASALTPPATHIQQRSGTICTRVNLCQGRRRDSPGTWRDAREGKPQQPNQENESDYRDIGVTFPYRIGGVQRAKSAQGTIKILLKSDFSSYFTYCLAMIWGPGSLPKRLLSYAPVPRY